MNLKEALQNILQEDEETVVFAKEPFALESEAIISYLTEDLAVPESVSSRGFKYFLERELVKELIEFSSRQNVPQRKLHELVLYYGINDAYPAWCFEHNDNGTINNA